MAITCDGCGRVFNAFDDDAPIPVDDDMLCSECRTCEHWFDVSRCYICQAMPVNPGGIANEA